MATLGLSKVFILDKYFTELQKFWETEKKLQGEGAAAADVPPCVVRERRSKACIAFVCMGQRARVRLCLRAHEDLARSREERAAHLCVDCFGVGMLEAELVRLLGPGGRAVGAGGRSGRPSTLLLLKTRMFSMLCKLLGRKVRHFFLFSRITKYSYSVYLFLRQRLLD